jgi:hypothetical protein
LIIATQTTYLTLSALKAMALDYDLSSYSDAQLVTKLTAATAVVDSMTRKHHIASEVTLQYEGSGNNRLNLARKPLCYIKKVELAVPGMRGWTLALDQLLVDYPLGFLKIFQPILWSGSYYAMFPKDATIEVTFAHGFGYTVSSPAVTIVDSPGGTLPPGQYDVAVTSKTPWGDSVAPIQTVTSASGALMATVSPVLGAILYRAFAAPHGTTPLTLVGESSHTAYGSSSVQIPIGSMSAPAGYWLDTLPTIDSSAHPIPAEFVEATRLIFLSGLYEQNSLANRGISNTRSGGKSVQWRSTTGSSDKGTPVLMDQARALLASYSTLVVL